MSATLIGGGDREWPYFDTCNECLKTVRLAVVDLIANSASGYAPGDPVYVHVNPEVPDEPERCWREEDITASTSLRDIGLTDP